MLGRRKLDRPSAFSLTLLLVVAAAWVQPTEGTAQNQTGRIDGSRVAVIIPLDGYEEFELTRCIGLFESAGADLTIVSAGKGLAHAVTGGTVEIDAVLGEIEVSRFDAIVLFDSPLVFKYPNDPRIHTIVRAAVGQGKVLGALSFAPLALANSGVLQDRRATVSYVEATGSDYPLKVLRDSGCEYTGEAVTVDGNIVTGNGLLAAEEFAKAVIALLAAE